MSLLFFSKKMAFFRAFLRAILFFQSLFRFCLPSKSSICKDKAHRGTPKEAKMSLLFSLIERHFYMHFYVPFHFFKVPFDVAFLPRAAFCKAKLHRGTPEGGKMSLLVFSNQRAFFYDFYLPFNFFKVFFNFVCRAKAAFCKCEAHGGTPKGVNCHFFFSVIKPLFSCIFTCHFIFDFLCRAKAAFCKSKVHLGRTKRRKNVSSFLF